MKHPVLLLIALFSQLTFVQSKTIRVLFLGNSYTGVNNLPQLVSDVANSIGDTVIFDSNTPGGYTLYGHAHDSTSMNKIRSGNWDFVVLQEQSLTPAFPDSFLNDMFRGARSLDSLITLYNPCAETIFYMTWSRKNGNTDMCLAYPWWPYPCTYETMDSLLNLRYRMMADSNNAIISPVGSTWHYIRQQFPSIELYQSDESHPSLAGSYAAACSFYSSLFRKDPMLITYNAGLIATDADNIKFAAKTIVYDSLLNWHIGEFDPFADFTYVIADSNEIIFNNSSLNATSFSWEFGDGDTSTSIQPTHIYDNAGSYQVRLIASACNFQDTIFQTVNANLMGILENSSNEITWNCYPNPAQTKLAFQTNLKESLNYKIFNLYGSLMQSGFLNYPKDQLDVSAFPDGIYVLQLFNNHNSLGQQKFIKIN